ncbi:hypothetical protein [uncultured Leifsonia sp.]|uniref:hypothetical protein n=1 Tax=uncultured Leifsonia sp. TaxID=340359 RepID=UPI0025EEA4B1|nr:hypothetical protein [uncultured Leifsonia sp.]
MGRRATALPIELTSGPFRTRDAEERRVTAGRLRAKDLVTPIRGVRLSGHADDLDARCRAFLLHRDERLAFSHTTAAELLGAPLPLAARDHNRLHVSVPRGERAVQAASVIGHTLAAWSTTTVRGLPVTTPEQTWLDLAGVLGRDALISAGDWLVSYRHPLTTLERLVVAVRSSAGRRGIANARAALPLIRTRSESPAETRLRLLIRDAGLCEPELNYLIHERDGAFLARVDMAFPDQRVVLEYEGDGHRVDRDVWFRDIRRREDLEDLGWRVVRVTAADLHAPAPLIARLSRLLTTRRE